MSHFSRESNHSLTAAAPLLLLPRCRLEERGLLVPKSLGLMHECITFARISTISSIQSELKHHSRRSMHPMNLAHPLGKISCSVFVLLLASATCRATEWKLGEHSI